MERLRFTFRVFDVNNNGFISLESLQKILTKCKTDMKARHITALAKDILKEMDEDHDRRIMFEEFVRGTDKDNRLIEIFFPTNHVEHTASGRNWWVLGELPKASTAAAPKKSPRGGSTLSARPGGTLDKS